MIEINGLPTTVVTKMFETKVEKSIFNGARWPGEGRPGENGGFVSLGRFGGIRMG